jgi:hypothetical protein
MKQPDPSPVNQLQTYRPPCSKCGAPTMLARVELAASADHDSRSFECIARGHSDTALVKFK